MKTKCLAMMSPLCLCLLAGSARAELEPFSLGASETIGHQSNFNHSDDSVRIADWTSTTELNAAVDEALGRDKLVASGAVDFNRYKRQHSLDATGFRGAAEFDWNTIGDLSGAIGADANRRQYVSGETSDIVPVNSTTPTATLINVRNLQTDTHQFARVSLGGESRWTIFGGVDANQRKYSNDLFSVNNERQWSTNAGTRYSTSPDLSFGVQGSYLHGEYPHGSVLVPDAPSRFSSRSFDLTSKWQASGNSALDATIGYTSDSNQALKGDNHFINGSVNWAWTPPSHFTVNVGFKRSSDADPTTGVNVGIVNQNDLNGTSINNVGHLEVTYSLTAKVNLDASADYTQRRYANVIDSATSTISGSTRTARFYLTAHYQPTLTTDLSCGGGRETRHVDADLVLFTPAYTDNYLQCVASIRFD